MAKQVRRFGLSLLISLSMFSAASFAENISSDALPAFHIFTEDWVPFQFHTEEGVLDGMAVELLEQIFEDLGATQTKDDMKLVPWARAMRALDNINTIVFSMTVTNERLSKYKWVGPIFDIKSYIYVKSDSTLTEDDFRPGNTLTTAIIIDDVSEQYLDRLYVDKDRVFNVSALDSPIKMLNHQRVDFIIDNKLNFKELAARAGLNLKDFIQLFGVDHAEISYAISLKTSDTHVVNMQKALDRVKASPAYNELLIKYDL